MKEQFPHTCSGPSGSQAEVILVLRVDPISQMRETEAQRDKLGFLARVAELGSAPRSVYSGAPSLPTMVGCASCFSH